MPSLYWKDEEQVDSLRERPSEMDKSSRRRACQWADSKWTLEKLQVVMQLVKGVSGFIHRVRTGGQIQFGVRENVTKRCEIHEREQTCPGTATVETWTFAIHNAASRHRRNVFGMESESWSSIGSGSESARPKTEEQKRTLLGFVVAEGLAPLNEISLLSGKVFLTRDVMQEKERYSKARPNVWTKPKEEQEHGELLDDARPMYPQEARTRGTTEQRMERCRDRGADQLPLVRHASGWRTKRESIQTTFCIRKCSATRDTERDASAGANSEPTGARTKSETRELGVTHHRESEEDREQDVSKGGSHSSDTTDAADDRSYVPAVFVEGPRRSQREEEIGHAVE